MPGGRAFFSIARAQAAAKQKNWNLAMQNYLVSLHSLSPDRRLLHLSAFCAVFDAWLDSDNEHLSRACDLLPNLGLLFPKCAQILVALATRLYHSCDEKLLLSCINICREALLAATGSQITILRIMLCNLCTAPFGQWHIRMINDKVRNSKFEEAICRSIQNPKDVVFDIGTGTGLLAVFASRYSEHVYAIEDNIVLCQVANQVFVKNGVQNCVQMIESNSIDFVPENKASVIVSEILDCCVFGEGVVDTFLDAHRRFAKNDTIFIPAKAVLYVTLVECLSMYKMHASDVNGVKFRSNYTRIGQRQPDQPYWCCTMSEQKSFRRLSEPTPLISVDFGDIKSLERCRNVTERIEINATADGNAHFFVVHFRAELCDNVVIDSNSDGSCWDQGIYPLANAVQIKSGQKMFVDLQLNDNRLDLFLENSCDDDDYVVRDISQIVMSHDDSLSRLIVSQLPSDLSQVLDLTNLLSLDLFLRAHQTFAANIRERPPQTHIATWLVRSDGSFDTESFLRLEGALTCLSNVTKVIPDHLRLHGCLFSSERIASQARIAVNSHCGVDLSPAAQYSLCEYRGIDLASSDVELCSDVVDLHDFSFDVSFLSTLPYKLFTKNINMTSNKNATVDGVLYWWSSGGYSSQNGAHAAFLFSERIETTASQSIRVRMDMHKGCILLTGEKT